VTRRAIVLPLFLTAFFAAPAYSQDRNAPPSSTATPAPRPADGRGETHGGAAGTETVSPELRADILRLFDAMHLQTRFNDAGRVTLQVMRPRILALLPATPNRDKITDAFQEKLLSLFSSQEFTDRYVELYARLLSDDDVKALTDFYQTPAGEHYSAALGQLTSASAQIGQDLAKEHVPDILQSLCESYPELDGKAAFCGNSSPQK